ncbi:hypothetical protein ACFL08_04895 [Patescibacteria group bacterium]
MNINKLASLCVWVCVSGFSVLVGDMSESWLRGLCLFLASSSIIAVVTVHLNMKSTGKDGWSYRFLTWMDSEDDKPDAISICEVPGMIMMSLVCALVNYVLPIVAIFYAWILLMHIGDKISQNSFALSSFPYMVMGSTLVALSVVAYLWIIAEIKKSVVKKKKIPVLDSKYESWNKEACVSVKEIFAALDKKFCIIKRFDD